MATQPPQQAPDSDVRFTYKFASVFVHRAKSIQCCVLVAALVAAAILGAFGLGGFTETDSFNIRDDFRTEAFHALGEAQDIVLADFAAARNLPLQGVKAQLHDMFLVFKAKNGANLASPDVMASIHALDAEFVGSENYGDVCLVKEGACVAPTTLVKLDVPGVGNYSGPQVETPTTQALLDAAVTEYVTATDKDTIIQRNFLFDASVTASDLSVEYYRSYYPMGRPLEGYQTAADDVQDQFLDFQDKIRFFFDRVNVDGADTAEYEVVLFGGAAFDIVFKEQVRTDTLWGLGAMVFVVFFIWFHTRSLYLASMGLAQLVLTFPFAMVIYHGVLNIVMFESLHSLALFLLLGIGADDIFVFTDAFNQNKSVQSDDLVFLMESTYLRAAKAMFVTSFTTMAAFLATATSEILPIATFGLWAASLVFVNYLLVLTWFPPALIIWERTIRKREQCFCCCRRKKVSTDTKDKPKPDADGGAAPHVADNAAAASEPKSAMPAHMRSEVPGSTESRKDLLKQHALSSKHIGTIEPSEAAIPGEDHRTVERFFYHKYYPFLHKARYVILVVFFGLFVAGLVLTTQLQPLDKEEKFLPSDHFLERAMDWMDEFVATEADSNHVVTVVWGISGIDRSGTNKFDPTEVGTVVWDESFLLYDPAAQAAVSRACETIENRTDLTVALRSCFIRDFADFCVDTSRPFPYVAPGPVPSGRTADEHQHIEFGKVLDEWSYTENGENAMSDVDIGIQRVTVAGEEVLDVRMALLKVTSNIEPGQPRSQTLPVFNAWQELVTDLNDESPDTANKALQVSQAWLWMVVEDGLVTSAVNGVSISVAVSFVVLLLATMNAVIAVLAIVCIAGIVLCSLGVIQAQGGQLGITETISSVIIIGFSVDFVVHYGVRYVESTMKSRHDKTRDAVAGVGISVLAGGLTTLGASFFLLGGVILFFKKMGIMMMTVILFSLLWSNFGFLALLDTVGPINGRGDLWPYAKAMGQWCGTKCCKRKRVKGQGTNAGTAAKPDSHSGIQLQFVGESKADDSATSAL